MKRVAINGLGRIGRLVLRRCMEVRPEDVEIVALNKPSSPQEMAYFIKYDSVHGKARFSVEAGENSLILDGKQIPLFGERDPSKLPWKDLGVDIVIESTGRFVDANKANAHIQAGAKKVLISAPAKNEDITIVLGVNEEKYLPESHHIISNASCTTNCLAPVAKVLQETFGIRKGLMTTAHAYTNDQKTLDFPHSKFSRGRAAALSIIPTTTGAAKAISLVIPELKGKLNGGALRVPTPDVSVVDLTTELERSTTVEEVNASMKKAAEGALKDILAYEDRDLVSMDFVGDQHSSIFAAMHTTVVDNLVKTLAWYDNEWGYSCRILDLTQYILERGL